MSQIFTALRDPRVLSVGILGFASGLPFMLTLSTLTFWLFEAGISKTSIGLFASVTLPYSLKFLWAPVIDQVKIPILGKGLGHRRSWLVCTQILLIIALVNLGYTNPAQHLSLTAFWAFCVAFLSATQDVIYEAYRVEILKGRMQGYAIAASVLGYRVGLWVSGAGALYLAASFSWTTAYGFMAFGMVIGVIATLFSPDSESTRSPSIAAPFTLDRSKLNFRRLARALLNLVRQEDLVFLLFFIFFFKVGDTVLNVMTPCFLSELGYTKIEIAHVAKTFGIGTMILGGILGGYLLARYSLAWVVVRTCLAMSFASLMYVSLSMVGKNIPFLFLTMGIENFACGLSQATLIAYFTSRCQGSYTATHYAFISSLGSFCRVCLSAIAGWGADQLPWESFYAITGVISLLTAFFVLSSKEHFLSFAKDPQDDAISLRPREIS